MTDEKILAAIEALARKHLEWEGTLHPEQRLVEDLELDSLGSLTLAVEVEDFFRICIDPDSESQIITVGDLIAVVRRKLEDGASDPE